MKKIYKIILIFIIILIPFALGYYFFNGIQVYKYDVTVGNHIGFNLDADAIHFGTIPIGERGKRSTVIRNTGKKSKVRITAFGGLSGNIYASENNFILTTNESKEIEFYVYTDRTMQYKKYAGNIIFLLTKA